MSTAATAYTPVPELPDDASAWTRFVLGFRMLLILKDEMGNPEAGALFNRCFDLEAYAAIVEAMRGTESGRRVLAERPSLQGADLGLEALENLPEGTFGRALAGYFEDNGFPPFETTEAVETDIDYVSKRYRETHDLLHVITGYTTDDRGEMELQAFAMGNLGIRSPRLILPFAYPKLLLQGEAGWPWSYVASLRAAWRRGRAARPFLVHRFEDLWERPLAEVRAEVLRSRP